MSTHTRVWAGLCLAVMVATPAMAQTPDHPMTVRERPTGPPTSIEALVDKALAESPSITAAWARVDASKGQITQASGRAGVEVMSEHRDDYTGLNRETAVGVSWPLELGRRQARINVAVDQSAQAALTANELARQVATRVRLAAVRALAAERLLALTTQTVEAHHQWCDLLAERVRAGASSPLDRDAAEIELRLGQAAVAKLRGEADARWVELRAAAGLDPTAAISLTETLEEAVAAIRRDALSETAGAVEDRPDVAIADSAIEIAEGKASLARLEGKLDLKLSVTYMQSSSGFTPLVMLANGSSASLKQTMGEIALGATIMLPSPTRASGALASALAEKRAAQLDRDAVLIAARGEASAAAARDREAGRALELFTTGLLELGAHNLDVLRQSFDLGRVTRAEVIAEERRYRELQAAYVAALQDAYEARAMWRQALGSVR